MSEKIGLEAVLEDKDFRAGVSNYLKSIDSMSAETGRMASSAGSNLASLGSRWASVAGTIGVGIVGAATVAGGALVGLAVRGVQAAIPLEAKLSDITSILGATSDETEQLDGLITDLGLDPNLKVSAVEAADAIEMLARNGLKVPDIMNGAAHATVLLANATGADFSTAANLATDAMAIFGFEANEMITAVNGITSVTVNSKFGINDYALALAQGGGVAQQAGVSFNDFNASIAAMSPLFSSGGDAGTSFRTMLTRLANPTDEARTLMNDLNLEFYDAQGNLKDMSEISVMLNQALYQTSDALVEVGGRTAAQNADLTRLQDAYDKTTQDIRDYELGIKGASLTEEARAKKIASLVATQETLQGSMQPLLGITGDLVTVTKQLTEEERSAALATLFGSDATRAAAGIAGAGVVLYENAADAVEALGVSHEDLAWAIEGGITEYEALMIQMGQTSAPDMAATRMDNLAGALEILQGVFDSITLEIGKAFLPVLTKLARGATEFVGTYTDQFIGVFDAIAGGVELAMSALQQFLGGFLEGGLVQGLSDALSTLGVPESTQATITNFITKMGEFGTKAMEVITPIANFVAENVRLKDALAAIGVFIAAVVIPIIGSLLLAIAPIIGMVMAVVGIIALLRTAWENDWGGIQQKTSSAIEFVKTTVSNGLKQIQAWWQENGSAILTKATEVWVTVSSAVQNGINRIRTVVGTGLKAVQQFWATNGDAILTKAKEIWDGIVTAVKPSLDKIGTAVATAAGSIADSFSENGVMGTAMIGIDVLKGHIESIASFLSENRGIIVGSATAITGSLAAFAIAPTVAGWVGTLSAAWAGISTAVATAGGVGAAISGAWAGLSGGGVLASVVAFLGGPVTIALGAIVGAITLFAVAWSKNWGGIREKTATVLAALKAQFAPAFARIGEALTYAKEQFSSLSPVLARLGEAFKPVIDVIASILGPALGIAFALITSFISGLISGFAWLIEGITLVITGIVTAVTGIVEFVVGIIGAINAALNGDFASATEYLKMAWQGVLDFFAGIFTAIWGVIAGVLGFIIGFIWNFVRSIYDFFYTLYMELVGGSVVPDMVNAIWQWFVNMANWVVEVVMGFITTVINWFLTLYNQVVAYVIQMGMAIWLSMQELYLWFTETIATLVSTVSMAIMLFVLYLVARFTELKTKIVTVITTVATWLMQKFADLKEDLAQSALGMKNAIIQQFTEFKEDAKTAISTALTAIVNLFEGKDWGAVGSNIINAIKTGITFAIDGLVSAATTAATSVMNAINSALGINSPSKFGVDVGYNIDNSVGVGLIGGISRLAKVASSAIMEGISPISDIRVTPNLAPLGLPVGSPAVGTQGNTNITNNNYNLSVNSQQSASNIGTQFRLFEQVRGR